MVLMLIWVGLEQEYSNLSLSYIQGNMSHFVQNRNFIW